MDEEVEAYRTSGLLFLVVGLHESDARVGDHSQTQHPHVGEATPRERLISIIVLGTALFDALVSHDSCAMKAVQFSHCAEKFCCTFVLRPCCTCIIE